MGKDIEAIENYSIPDFRVEDMENDAYVLICGKRGTGRTTATISLLKNYTSKRGVVFCNSDEAHRYKKVFNNIKIVCDPSNFKFDETYDFIVVDSVFPNDKRDFIYRCTNQLKSLKIVVVQDPSYVPNYILQFVDYIFLTAETNQYRKEMLYKHYGKSFPTFELFNKMFNEYTKDWKMFVIDNFMNNLEYALYYFEFDNETQEAINNMIKNVRSTFESSEESSEELSEEWNDENQPTSSTNTDIKSNDDSYCVLM